MTTRPLKIARQFEQTGIFGAGDPFAVGPATRYRLSEERLVNHALTMTALLLDAEAITPRNRLSEHSCQKLNEYSIEILSIHRFCSFKYSFKDPYE